MAMPPKLTVRLSAVTPLFLGGADPKHRAELRPPSIKGLLRYWYRALDGDYAANEPRFFGSTDAGQSACLLRVGEWTNGTDRWEGWRDTREVDGRRNAVESLVLGRGTDDIGQGDVADEHVVHALLVGAVLDAKGRRCVALRVEVDDEHGGAGEGKERGEVDHRRRLADTTLLIRAGRDSDHARSAAELGGRHPILPVLASFRCLRATPRTSRIPLCFT